MPNAWATPPAIESYYQPFPACPRDIKDLIGRAREEVSGRYAQVGVEDDGSAIALPGHLLLDSTRAEVIDPVGDALFLYEAALQHASSNYQALPGVPGTPALRAKLRARMASVG